MQVRVPPRAKFAHVAQRAERFVPWSFVPRHFIWHCPLDFPPVAQFRDTSTVDRNVP